MSAHVLERRAVRTPGSGLVNRCRRCGRPCGLKDGPCERCRNEASRLIPHAGEIYSYTIVGQGAESFVLALVQLAGGRLVMGRIVGSVGELRIGLPVEFAPAEPGARAAGAAIVFRAANAALTKQLGSNACKPSEQGGTP